jgi:hypothetical protein
MDSAPRSQPQRRHLVSLLTADPYVWVIAFVPFYILAVSSNWIFSPPQSIDPWVYHGFFRNLQEYKADLFPGTYYGSRLSWILPGYVAYRFLPPLAANYVLHLGLWYTASFALYYAVRRTAGRQAGLVAAVLLGSYIHFLYAVGSDYVDGPANVYLLLCFALLTAAADDGRKRLAPAFAGAAFAAVVYTNLFTILFAPVVALYFALLARRARGWTLRGRLASLAWFLAGFAGLTVFLGCVNLGLAGSFEFYMPSVYYVMAHVGQPNAWKLPVAQWIGQAEWLVLPVVVAGAALIALGSRRFRSSPAGLAAAGAFLLACGLMILCEWRGIPVLQYSYYASYLIPPAFVVIGALLGGLLDDRPGAAGPLPASVALACVVLAIVTLPLWGYNAYLSQLRVHAWPFAPLALGGLFAICCLVRGKAASWAAVVALAACLATSSSIGYAFAGRHAERETFARIAQAADAVDAVRGDEFIWFWYSKADPHFAEFHALHSIYLWGYTMVGEQFPSVKPDAVIADGALVVIPSAGGEVLSCASQALYPKLFAAEAVDRREITSGGTSYSLWFARIRFDSARLEPLDLWPCESGGCSALARRGEAGSPAVELPLEGWIASRDPQTRLENTANGVSITTALSRQGYAAKYGPLVAEAAGRYVFKLQYVLGKGGIAFGAKLADDSGWLQQAAIPVSQPGERTAVLSLDAAAGEPFWLMIANDHPLGDHASQYAILELEAYRFPAAEAVTRR